MARPIIRDAITGVFWLSFKTTLLGGLYLFVNAVVGAASSFVLPLMAGIFNVPALTMAFGAAEDWFRLANHWAPISEAIMVWGTLYAWCLLWVPIKAAVKYFVPGVG